MKSVGYKFNYEGRNTLLPPLWEAIQINWRPFLWVNGCQDDDIHEQVGHIRDLLKAAMSE
jgi:hypothetical protein